VSEDGELKKYRPMTDAELQAGMHISVIVNLDKLPQLKGKGKASPEQRRIGIKVFAESLAKSFSACVIIMRPDWVNPGHSIRNGWTDRAAHEREDKG
jgi:hypothetical protein